MTQDSEDRTLEISVDLLPIVVIGGLAITGYAVGDLLGLGIALLAIPVAILALSLIGVRWAL